MNMRILMILVNSAALVMSSFFGDIGMAVIEGVQLNINAGRMNSHKTNIPFNFHDALPCDKQESKQSIEDNIGDILSGDRIYPTDYKLNILEDSTCQLMCEHKIDVYSETFLKFAIENDYHSNFYLDGLPAAYVNVEKNTIDRQGIPLGFYDKQLNQYFINNHITFIIELQHEDKTIQGISSKDQPGYSIVKFLAIPYSIEHKYVDSNLMTMCATNLMAQGQMPHIEDIYESGKVEKLINLLAENFDYNFSQKKFQIDANVKFVPLTYDIRFSVRSKEAKIVSRWDYLLKLGEEESIHWWGLINSSIIIFITSTAVMIIFARILKKDISYIRLVSLLLLFNSFQDQKNLTKLHGSKYLVMCFSLPKTDTCSVHLLEQEYKCFL